MLAAYHIHLPLLQWQFWVEQEHECPLPREPDSHARNVGQFLDVRFEADGSPNWRKDFDIDNSIVLQGNVGPSPCAIWRYARENEKVRPKGEQRPACRPVIGGAADRARKQNAIADESGTALYRIDCNQKFSRKACLSEQGSIIYRKDGPFFTSRMFRVGLQWVKGESDGLFKASREVCQAIAIAEGADGALEAHGKDRFGFAAQRSVKGAQSGAVAADGDHVICGRKLGLSIPLDQFALGLLPLGPR